MYFVLWHFLFLVLILQSISHVVQGRLDPEVDFDVPQIIKHWGYPAEEHKVMTSDGYIVTIHRIPHGKQGKYSDAPRPVVFLQHGLLCSSSVWVTNLPSEALAYILVDAGFDVWMGNARGNTYGLEHESLNPDQNEFWDFSWDEMAVFDLPAMIDYVLNATKFSSLSYIAHSQGSLIAFTQTSINKELAKKLNLLIALGPISTVKYITSPIRYLSPLAEGFEYLCPDVNECNFKFLSSSDLIKFLAKYVCSEPGIENLICENIIFLVCGFDYAQLNRTRLPVYLSHTPAGTSAKNIVHFAQMVESGNCQSFNYNDRKKNIAHYNMTEPPIYNMSNVHIPTVLYYGEHDWLADPNDVHNLSRLLPNLLYTKKIAKWQHLDFLWGLDAATLVYRPLITVLERFASR